VPRRPAAAHEGPLPATGGRLFADLGAVIDGCCDAWKRVLAERGAIARLTDYDCLQSV
jgi:hypothetical protein